MAVYAISDLHLALSVDKPMDIFGTRWQKYMDRLKESWHATVKPEDAVIIPGDVSWATYIDEAVEDFKFIDRLPGKKIICKGNHDYWWTTMSKLEKFLKCNGFTSIKFIQNNSYQLDEWFYRDKEEIGLRMPAAGYLPDECMEKSENSKESWVLCGTRGWKCPGDDDFTTEDEKIYRREIQRLELSLKSSNAKGEKRILVALHYPPFDADGRPSEFVDIMKKYGVKLCIYGHLHGETLKRAVEGNVDGIFFKLVSADYLNFNPARLYPKM